jgi:ATP-dependent helicase/nuclease subunit A
VTEDGATLASAPEHVIIRASAGTGKTHQLSNRYLRLVLDGCEVDRILATTFTRKAAGEIFARVMKRLAMAAASEKGSQQLAGELEQPSLTRGDCRQSLVRVIRNLHRVRVGTLDSFFGQVAHSFSLEVGLPPRWGIVDERVDSALRRRALEQLLADNFSRDSLTLVHLLTKGEASRDVNQLLLATVNDAYAIFRESDRDAWHGIARPRGTPDHELGLLVDDLRTCDLSQGGENAPKSLQKARDEAYRLALDGDWEGLIGKGLGAKIAAGETRFNRREIRDPLLSILRHLVEHTRAALVDRVANQTEGAYELLRRFDRYYQRIKRREGSFLFDDVPRLLAEILQSRHDPRLAFRIDGHIDHLLLDEFQDTSLVQWRVLKPFTHRVVSERDAPRSFFCVGDVKQAIYGWRGGMSEIFDNLKNELPEVREIALHVSYRSSAPVIDTVSRTFTDMVRHENLNGHGDGLRRWCGRFPRHRTMLADVPGYACLMTSRFPDNGESRRDTVLDCAADHIGEITKNAGGRTVGVLLRRNDAVAKMIYLLRSRRIPASEEGGSAITDSAAVRIVLSLLRLAEHPGDTLAGFHVCHSPLASTVGLQPGLYADQQQLADVSQRIRTEILENGYGPLVQQWVDSLKAHCGRREWSRLQQLVTLAYNYQAQSTLRTCDFAEHVGNQRVSDPMSTAVRVMTIHQAKGLEFDIVVLAELDTDLVGANRSFVVNRDPAAGRIDRVCRYAGERIRQLLPTRYQQLHQDDTDRRVGESLCLLYVAMTRARHALHMLVAPTAYTKNGRSKPGKTFAGLLRAALADSEPLDAESIAYEHGDSQWFQRAPAETPSPQAVARDVREPLAVRLAVASSQHTRNLDTRSPSQLEGGPRVVLRERLSLSKPAAFEYGTLIHAWFEHVGWLDDDLPTDDQLRSIAARTGACGVDVNSAIVDFRSFLAEPVIKRLLSRRSYTAPAAWLWHHDIHSQLASGVEWEVRNEQKIAVRVGDAVLSGNIDRLVVARDGERIVAADIIDYKTDNWPGNGSDQVAQRVEFYRPQIESYCQAAARMLQLDRNRIVARLAFVKRGIVTEFKFPSD